MQGLINVVTASYNNGLLQFDPMSICGMHISLEIKSRFNTLTINYLGVTRSITLWDSDDDQEDSIANLITDIQNVAA